MLLSLRLQLRISHLKGIYRCNAAKPARLLSTGNQTVETASPCFSMVHQENNKHVTIVKDVRSLQAYSASYANIIGQNQSRKSLPVICQGLCILGKITIQGEKN